MDVAATILERILGLEHNPRPRQSLKMRGRPERWRLRVGEYRVIYAISDAAKVVFVHDVLRRTGQTYR